MRAVRILFVRRAETDVTVDDDERRFFGLVAGFFDGAVERFQIVRVGDVLDEPAVGFEAERDIFGECERRFAFDGDFVVVVKNNALIKSQSSLHFSSCLKKKLTELLCTNKG